MKKAPVLKQFAGMWTLTHQPDIHNPKKEWSVEEKFRQAKKQGFDAMGVWAAPELFVPLAKKYKMDLVVYIDGNWKTYKERIDALAKMNPSRVNVQMLDHDTLPAEAVKLWLVIMDYAKKLGLADRMDLEVHRDTCTETPEKTYEIAKLYQQKTGKKIQMCFDFSHFAVVKHIGTPYRNRLLVERLDLTQKARQLHLRPFNGHHCQVPLTDGKGKISVEGKHYIEFVNDLIVAWLKAAKGGETLYVCPEFGPWCSTYGLTTFPDVWKDACLLRRETEKSWKKNLALWQKGALK
ncbi:MAG: xylose isomerase [Verrucomicrobiae bacterium]|nr:xylose isomerase [Verrucomicrobiae bacterium]